jgi:hypothetical protein
MSTVEEADPLPVIAQGQQATEPLRRKQLKTSVFFLAGGKPGGGHASQILRFTQCASGLSWCRMHPRPAGCRHGFFAGDAEAAHLPGRGAAPRFAPGTAVQLARCYFGFHFERLLSCGDVE